MLYIQNAFSSALGKFDFDVFKILVVDVLHELELGVGKGVFTHLIRILESLGPHQILTLNERYDEMDLFSIGWHTSVGFGRFPHLVAPMYAGFQTMFPKWNRCKDTTTKTSSRWASYIILLDNMFDGFI